MCVCVCVCVCLCARERACTKRAVFEKSELWPSVLVDMRLSSGSSSSSSGVVFYPLLPSLLATLSQRDKRRCMYPPSATGLAASLLPARRTDSLETCLTAKNASAHTHSYC
ncbi:hypothetical protein ABB37_08395 [Leptomonas pyrrhocoris]|uniref:Uncharacterized protein n=1 Tax=Leptomonas pyrrhocoris TaxID=157538 RepID=A0A0N0DS72_LEPPY|nr:hypothetical protein ABB37_08395 [Leptomonas pyrrhocoris]KPA75498.1 hypothetical protein ABB37_08395 [Leptomonas pyrrhocoris]|eukprot:XP_015653937.1 hypothetical protein ABB37_08395 [Leptomonas pyrrhocoris]